MRLLVRVGKHCDALMDEHVSAPPTSILEIDEAWTYVGRKDKRLTEEEAKRPDLGSQFIFVGMDRETKFVPAWLVGKRSPEVTFAFIRQLRRRVGSSPKMVTDGYVPYIRAIHRAFDDRGSYAQLVKQYSELVRPVREGYGPARVIACERVPIFGRMRSSDVSTSMIERQNWTLRTRKPESGDLAALRSVQLLQGASDVARDAGNGGGRVGETMVDG